MESGRNPFTGLDLSSIEVKLPRDEQSFQLGIDYETPVLPAASPLSPGSLLDLPVHQGRPDVPAYLVRLAVLRMLILQYLAPYHPRNGIHIPENAPWESISSFHIFEQELSTWSAAFPADLRFSTDNLYRRQPHIVGFLTFHCMFHGCYCDLFRIGSYITTSNVKLASTSPFSHAPNAFLNRCRQGRVEHAIAITNIIALAMKHLTTEHDPFMAISACLTIRILAIERQPEDSGLLGNSVEELRARLRPAVQCAKKTAQWSAPIRKLLHAVHAHARQSGFDFDVSDIQQPGNSSLPQTRPASPSLRTYGTFGSIQSSLAKSQDTLTPAGLTKDTETSDIFVASGVSARLQPRGPQQDFPQASTASPMLLHSCFDWDAGPSAFQDPSMLLGWADHSLGFDPTHDWTSALL